MPSFEFCLSTRATAVPDGPDRVHEVKYDGCRLRLERDGKRVNWTDRYPWIVEAARKVRQKRFVIDGEAAVLGVDGVSDFDALHSRQHDEEVQLCAFDLLAEGGDDVRKLPLLMRRTNLARLLARRPDGIFEGPFEQGEIGPELFRAACQMGMEGLVSKRQDRQFTLASANGKARVSNYLPMPIGPHFNDRQHWRKRAEESRVTAGQMFDKRPRG